MAVMTGCAARSTGATWPTRAARPALREGFENALKFGRLIAGQLASRHLILMRSPIFDLSVSGDGLPPLDFAPISSPDRYR